MLRRALLVSLLMVSGCQRSDDPRLIAERQEIAELGNQMAFVREAGYASEEVSQKTDAVAVQQVVDAQNQFAFDLYRELAATDGNLFFSPASISMALSMALAGADGETRDELATALHLQANDPSVFASIASLNRFLGRTTADHGIELNTANALWGDKRIQFEPAYLKLTQDSFAATLRSLDFRNSEASRQTINQWVEEQTKKRIRDLIPSGAINADTGLVLTNAIYFLGKWTDPFEKSATRPDQFFVTPSDVQNVPMMNRSDASLFAEVDGVKLLQLPYGDETFSMLLILPQEKDGLAKLETQLSIESLKQWQQGIRNESEVRVSIPKFKSESAFELSSVLKSLGVQKAFDEGQADFTNIAAAERLFISQVIHKSFVDVNEAGTEAAAATAVIMATASAPVEPKEPPTFIADHPFVYLIKDNRTEQIVFIGRLAKPDSE